MFDYSDPSGSGDLARLGALGAYRTVLDGEYGRAARNPGSAFTWLEAFAEADEQDVERQTLRWRAVPRKAVTEGQSRAAIDADRLRFQDEYVEWAIARGAGGAPIEIVFSTEFREYFEVLAGVGVHAVREGIKSVYAEVDLTTEDLFGFDGDADGLPAHAREAFFSETLRRNPVNAGGRILCLTHQNSSMAALFALVNDCGVPKPGTDPGAICPQVPCVSERNSDPFICSAAQQLAQAGSSFTLADPAGIHIVELTGIWRFGDREFDINDADQNEGVWSVTRTRRRATLRLRDGLSMDGRRIRSGAQLAANLIVGADVLAARDDDLPAWARMGNEALRR